jgi:N-acetylglucosamine-6-phosphate deacetylase
LIKVLFNGRIFDGARLHHGQALVLEDGRVKGLVEEKNIPDATISWDLRGRMLAPGLVDMQVNGGGGVMFNDEPSIDGIKHIAAAHRRFGTTGLMPTLISTDSGTMKKAMAAVGQAVAQRVPGVLGIHLEGPFLNPLKCGIHRAERFSTMDEAALELLTSLEAGCTLVTLAPEKTPGEMIQRLVSRGVRVFGGHSNASYQQARAALQSGMHGFTHLFNAMSGLESREPGMVGAALEDDESWFGIIADGQHVHPASLAVAVRAKARGYAVLVTDAMATVGSRRKRFVFDGVEMHSVSGSCRTKGGQLAGSDLDMMTAVRNTVRFTGLDKLEVLRMASTYPARALGLGDQLGLIRPGFRANFIELDEKLELHRTWIDGEADG